MKITGAEFKEWYDNHFPVGFFHDGSSDAREIHAHDGQWLLSNDEIIDPDELGELVWGGRAYGAASDDDPTNAEGLAFSVAIKRWRKTSTHEFVTAFVPRDRVEEAKAALKALGAIEVVRP